MSAADYNKGDATNFGRAIGNLIGAVKKDGVGASDFQQLIAAVTAAGAVVNEMRDVPEAAVEHVLAGAADTLGDQALQKALDAEAAAG